MVWSQKFPKSEISLDTGDINMWKTGPEPESLFNFGSGRRLRSRDEHLTGLGLDWIRTIANFVEFRLDPDCKSLRKLGTGPDLDWVNGKDMRHFFVKRQHFSNILDFIWTWTSHLQNILDYSWTWTEFLKIRTGSGSQNMTVRSSLLRSYFLRKPWANSPLNRW